MSTQNEQQAAAQLLYGYLEVLNTAVTGSISSFYTHDGLFMPDGFKTLTREDLENAGSNYLQKKNFKISYDNQSVTIKQEFACINATAHTSGFTSHDDHEIHRSSRDSFVLRMEGTEWKIFRYVFNKLSEYKG